MYPLGSPSAAPRQATALVSFVYCLRHLLLPSGSATHGVDDLDLVAVLDPGVGVLRPLGDLAVQGHRGELAADLEMSEGPVDRDAGGQFHRLAVHGDRHEKNRTPFEKGCGPVPMPPRRVPFAGITQCRFEGSRAAPGSQETSPTAAIRDRK